VPALIACLGLFPAGRVAAQTFTTLHNFTPRVPNSPYTSTNSDGCGPYAGLILSGNTLYGTANSGGSGDAGTVFRVNTDGTDFTNLYNCTDTSTNGYDPNAGFILSGNTLYGTTMYGGSSGGGTVFAINTDGTGFTNLCNFTEIYGPYDTNSYGFLPNTGLVLSGNTLYGTANFGGSWSYGTVFAVKTDGTGFTNVHNFNFYDVNDGADPYGGLISSGNTLYGTTLSGGASGNGTVFSVSTDGTGFTNVYSFTAASGSASTNSDGLSPCGGLILSGNTLYGTTGGGGSSGKGTVFKVNTNGSCFVTLHSFTALSNGTNSDGGHPEDGLILSGNTLYGTASEGGNSGGGTVFSVTTRAV